MGNRYTSGAYRELGGMLRQAQAGLSSERLACMLGWPLTTVSRMENGGRTSTTTDVIQYLVVCGLKVRAVWPIVEFCRIAERKQGYYLSDERIDGSLQSLIFHEASAEHSIILRAAGAPRTVADVQVHTRVHHDHQPQCHRRGAGRCHSHPNRAATGPVSAEAGAVPRAPPDRVPGQFSGWSGPRRS
jgi:Helix-turn-helix domain